MRQLSPSPFVEYELPDPPRRRPVSEKLLADIAQAAAVLRDVEIGPAIGLYPSEWRQLYDLPDVRYAIDAGRVRARFVAGRTVMEAAEAGDSRAAMDYLTHQGGWMKQVERETGEVEKAKTLIDLSKLSDDELNNLLTLQQKAISG